ncbi:hypothetical protein [Ferruginibacter sp. SUN106]|uniref:hypothetical protein n=1 Tax=Ferruginibacter sp. SUN106 TaxID=2978348 RepID=UPI003D35E560
MKTVQLNILLLSFIAVFTASCQKDTYNMPNAKCLVTYTEEDLYGTSLNIVYNQKGDPVTLSLSGFPATILYDAKGRLLKVNFGTGGVHFDYLYNDNTFLPAILKYYRPGQGGLISIDSFHYNNAGQLIKRENHNLLDPAYNNAQKFEYNNKGNLKKVTISSQSGGSVFNPAVVAFEATRYDDNYNFMGGNQWIKYLLFYSDMEDYGYLLFSVNNAMDWKWGYPEGNVYKVTTALKYNVDGFATLVNGHYFDTDGVTELTSFIRTNTSTCDTPAANHPATENKLVQPSRNTSLHNTNSEQ